MIPVIGVNGRAQHGKDTIVQILHDLYGYERVAFADILKNVAYNSKAEIPTVFGHERIDKLVDAIGWEDAKKNQYVREFLQGLGVAGRLYLAEDVWVAAAYHNAPKGKLLAISDMRFPNEFQSVKDRGGITIRVTRPGIPSVNEHISETALDNHAFDYYLTNDETVADLAQQVIEVVEGHNSLNRLYNEGARS